MFKYISPICAALLALSISPGAIANDSELSLFDGSGNATAYIATNEGLTIYLWSGAPVAYLDERSDSDADVYGFNGKHLGWFVSGVIYDDSGYAACALRQRMQFTNLEPLKSLKDLKPLKSLKELAPLRPLLQQQFGDVPCGVLLGGGVD